MSVRQEIIYDEKQQKEFEDAMNLAKDVLHYRIFELGMTAKEAMQTVLTTKKSVEICSKPYKYEYKGMFFTSTEEIAKKFKINPQTLRARLHQGFSLKEAIETPLNQRKNGRFPIECKGIIFYSMEELSKHFKISTATLARRMKTGLSLVEAVEMEKWKRTKKKYVYKDETFSSIEEVCKRFNISRNAFCYGMSKGASFAEIIERSFEDKKRPYVSNEQFEYEGVIYASKRHMCSVFNIDYNAFMKRLSRGWTIKKALETPFRKHKAS